MNDFKIVRKFMNMANNKNIVLSMFIGFIMSGSITAQASGDINSTASTTVTTAGMRTLLGDYTNNNVTFQQMISDYDSGLITYDQLNAKYSTLMGAVNTKISEDASLLLQNTKAKIDNILRSSFTTFVQTFNQYYGQAILLTSNLSYPIGRDRITQSPGLILGVGGGTSFTNVNKIKDSITGTSGTMFSELSVLPTFGLTINAGIKLSDRWSLRLSLMPTSNIALPVSEQQLQSFDLSFKYGEYRGRISYALLDDKKFSPGISLSAFAGYTIGEISLAMKPTTYSPMTSIASGAVNMEIVATPSFDAVTECKWSNFIAGPEIRFWYNLDFLFPYIGYGIGFQTGTITTSFSVNSQIALTQNASTVLSDGKTLSTTTTEVLKETSTIIDVSNGDLYQHRILLGLQIKISMVDIAGEISFDPQNSLSGVSIGANFGF